ncbi:hypothetical protein BBJ28_00011923 [Nothophytophthora sp. Chile5]|nr:hypothetical protein BBJ28_00011923 [Nothophytophthora sp. Chile5]
MQLVLDATTAAEASTWARAIAVEIKRNRLFSKMRELSSTSTEPQWGGNIEEKQHPGNWMQIMAQSSAIPGKQNALEISLRSLYARIDRLDEKARAERYRSWTLTQALKDLQRDRVQINGEMQSSASLEANIIALMLKILRSASGREDRTVTGRLGDAVAAPSSNSSAEMAALCFARQLIMCSSRTRGGGDILDTLHLLFGTERFCICPDAQAMEPIEIVLSRSSNAPATLSARITMKMTYRVIPTESVTPIGAQSTSRDCDGERESVGSSKPTDRQGEYEQTEYKIIGTYTQKLTYGSMESNEVNGSVQVEFADLGEQN